MQLPANVVVVVAVVVLCLSAGVTPVSSADVTKDGEGGKKNSRVLLVSMDGFRWDYLKTVPDLGNFSRIATSGCSVSYMKPPFATKTFPCHYTLATGLYEETHGIVSNRMYDPEHNATFGKQSLDSFWWDGGEPIWVTAERQNKKTGVYFWPGSEAEIRGYRPSTYMHYNQSVPFDTRVDTALGWLKSGDKDLVLLYFHEPDHTGHVYGPRSPEIVEKVQEMDGVLGTILNSMEEMKLDDVNIILVSDHGMTDVSAETRLINLWDYVDNSSVQMVPDSGPVTAILPEEGREEEVYNATRQIPHVTSFWKEDIPDHFHYTHNPRIMPIVVISDEGWMLSSDIDRVKKGNEHGDHGFSNDLPSMRAIFFARGPDFRKGGHTDFIRSIDIYPLICRLLGIEPSPNNGTLAKTAEFLLSTNSGASDNNSRYVSGWLVCLWVLVGWLVQA